MPCSVVYSKVAVDSLALLVILLVVMLTWRMLVGLLLGAITGCPTPVGGLIPNGVGLANPLVLLSYRFQAGVDLPLYCKTPDAMMAHVASQLSRGDRRCAVDTVATPGISEMLRMTCQWKPSPDRCDHVYWVYVWPERSGISLRDYRLLGLAWVSKLGCSGGLAGQAFAADPAVLHAAATQSGIISDILSACRGVRPIAVLSTPIDRSGSSIARTGDHVPSGAARRG